MDVHYSIGFSEDESEMFLSVKKQDGTKMTIEEFYKTMQDFIKTMDERKEEIEKAMSEDMGPNDYFN